MFYCLTPNIEDDKSKNNLWQKATPCFKFYTTEMHDQRERDGDVYTCKNKCGSCCKKWHGFLSFDSKGGVPQTATLSLKWICCSCFFLKLLLLERFAAATGEVVSVKDNRLQGLGCGDSRFSCWRLAGGWSELLLTLLEAPTSGSGEDVMGCWTMKKIKCWNSCWCYCSAGTLSLLCWK